jgi:hypothetical protein
MAPVAERTLVPVRRTSDVWSARLGGLALAGCFLATAAALVGPRATLHLATYPNRALGLIDAGPWGVAVAAAGWLRSPASLSVLTAVAASALVATVGPQMTGLVLSSASGWFAAVVVLAAALAVTSLLVRRPAREGRR